MIWENQRTKRLQWLLLQVCDKHEKDGQQMPEDWEEDEEMIWSWYSDESGGSGSYGCLDSELESEGDS